MTDRKLKRVQHIELYEFSMPVEALVKILIDETATIPDEHRDSAFAICATQEGEAYLGLRYIRPETDEEMAERIKYEEEERQWRESYTVMGK